MKRVCFEDLIDKTIAGLPKKGKTCDHMVNFINKCQHESGILYTRTEAEEFRGCIKCGKNPF